MFMMTPSTIFVLYSQFRAYFLSHFTWFYTFDYLDLFFYIEVIHTFLFPDRLLPFFW